MGSSLRAGLFVILAAIGAMDARAHGVGDGQGADSSASPGGEVSDMPRPGHIVPARPAVDPHDRPTLGDPARRIYGQQPALGDPRPYRRTSPLDCRGLLCD
jgi:hypothetical protein